MHMEQKQPSMPMLDKVGLKQVSRLITSGQAECVYLAQDADAFIQKRVTALCEAHGISVISADSMRLLGQQCGISVGAAVAATAKR